MIGILLPFFFTQASGFLNATIIALAYVVMALGLNVVVGFAGLLDLGYVAFYALGAYCMGWFGSDFFFNAHIHVLVSGIAATETGIHLNFVLILVVAALMTALAGTLIGLPTLRLRSDYIAIVTLAFGEIIGVVAVNGTSIHIGGGETLTAGAQGISALDLPYFPGIGHFSLLKLSPWYWLIFGIMLLVLFVALRLRDSRLGPRLDRAARGRGRGRLDGDPARQDEADGVRDRRHLRRHVGRLPGRLRDHRQLRPVPVLVLDLRARDGHRRRPRIDLGRGARRAAALLHQLLPDPRRAQQRPARRSA